MRVSSPQAKIFESPLWKSDYLARLRAVTTLSVASEKSGLDSYTRIRGALTSGFVFVSCTAGCTNDRDEFAGSSGSISSGIDRVNDLGSRENQSDALRWLWGAFIVQVAGRLLDFWWHATHDEFETGGDQIQAHWLVWLGTILVLAAAIRALRTGVRGPVRAGYLIVLIANGLYVPIAVAHFIQHLNRQEVDWAHAGLGITNVIAALGILYVTFSWRRIRGASVGLYG
jgi:hypothetical protein